MATEEFAGPVDFVVFAFPAHAPVGPGFEALLGRVQQGLIEVLDIELVVRGDDGGAVRRPLADLGDVGLDVVAFDGVTSDILDDGDLAIIGDALADGEVAVAVIYEDRSLAPVAAAWAQAGGRELFSGGVAIADLEAALTEGIEG